MLNEVSSSGQTRASMLIKNANIDHHASVPSDGCNLIGLSLITGVFRGVRGEKGTESDREGGGESEEETERLVGSAG